MLRLHYFIAKFIGYLCEMHQGTFFGRDEYSATHRVLSFLENKGAGDNHV